MQSSYLENSDRRADQRPCTRTVAAENEISSRDLIMRRNVGGGGPVDSQDSGLRCGGMVSFRASSTAVGLSRGLQLNRDIGCATAMLLEVYSAVFTRGMKRV